MKDGKLRIGFVGVGFMGQMAHLRNYAAVDECEVTAIAELRQDTARQVAARYGVPRVYASADAMLAEEKLDGIVASQPFTRHGILVPELLKTGVPVFTEKPIGGSVEVGERIVKAVEGSGTFHMVGYHKRSDPATMLAVEEIAALKASGALGAMRYVRVLMPAGDWIAAGGTGVIAGEDAPVVLDTDPPAGDMDADTYGRYIGFVNYYIHQVNLVRHLLGEPYAVEYAHPSGVLLAGSSASGVPCSIEMSPYQTTMDWQESALVCFEKGYVKLELPAPLAHNRPGRLEIFRDPGNGARPVTEIPQLPWIHGMRQQALNFIAAIRGDRPPMCTAAEALEDLKVARDYLRLLTGK